MTPDPRALLQQALERARGAGSAAEAARWYDRAHRIAPEDDYILLEHALAALRAGRPEAAALFAAVADRHDAAEIWAGVASARALAPRAAGATDALAFLLSCHAFREDWRALADRVAGPEGWCALRGDGTAIGPGDATWRLDGQPVGRDLPPGWQGARQLAAARHEIPLVGSPIQVARIVRLDGFVRRAGTGVEGWAWHPADPDRNPVLHLPDGTTLVLGRDSIGSGLLPGEMLAAPRRFALPLVAHPAGADGMPLAGAVGQAGAAAARQPPPRLPRHAATRTLVLPLAATDLPELDDGSDLLVLPPGLVLRPGMAEALRRAACAGRACGIAATLPCDDAAGATGPAFAVTHLPEGAAFYLRHDVLRAAKLRPTRFFGAWAALADLVERAVAAGWRCRVLPRLAHPPPLSQALTPGQRQAAAQDRARLRAAAPDELAACRRAAWTQARVLAGTPCVLLVGHGQGGGTANAIALRVAAVRDAGRRALVLKPDGDGAVLTDPGSPPARFALPANQAALRVALHRLPLAGIEVHHLLGHPPATRRMLAGLGVPYDVWLHDRISFADRPFLAGARRRIVPCRDLCRDLRRASGLSARVAPLDTVAPPAVPPPYSPGLMRTICLVGALNREKGFDILLACARDAARRRLRLRFVLVGFSQDDAALIDTGHVFVTGPFAEAEVAALIGAQGGQLGFVPSIATPDWRETWCFALSHLWQAGLPVAAFAIGAPAERIGKAGPSGGVLLPPGMHPRAINDVLAASVLSESLPALV